jgi:hypothetical protein
MAALNAVLGAVTAKIPPARNIETELCRVWRKVFPKRHAFVTANETPDGEAPELLPPPAQWCISTLSSGEAAEMIETYIEHYDAASEDQLPVHYPAAFAQHYLKRADGVLPIVSAIATLPIVSADGHILTGDGLDRASGIVYAVPPELTELIPNKDECTAEAVAKAWQFLADVWLMDVATDLNGKAILVALCLTLIERSITDDRPVFWITAPQRGTGKTTIIKMIIKGVLGEAAAASPWSFVDEERRKALLAYLISGAAYILWDNIPRGTQISCQHIEMVCTTENYTDRVLRRQQECFRRRQSREHLHRQQCRTQERTRVTVAPSLSRRQAGRPREPQFLPQPAAGMDERKPAPHPGVALYDPARESGARQTPQ